MAFALPVGRSLKARREDRSSHSTLFGVGVHRHRMFPLGVEKWQGTFELFGPLHASWTWSPRALDETADADVEATVADSKTVHAKAPTANSTAARRLVRE